jgi:hypothetical protein
MTNTSKWLTWPASLRELPADIAVYLDTAAELKVAAGSKVAAHLEVAAGFKSRDR